jgi:PhoPQ-activated pathogenicity-related protein
MGWLRVLCCTMVVLLLLNTSGIVRADLFDYVKKPEPKFAWKFAGNSKTPRGTVYSINFVSQVWQDIPWEHDLQVFVPEGVKPGETVFLWNQGGKPGLASGLFGMELADKMKAPVAFLYGIPKQPLFDGKKEDALIAETFLRYLKTKDEDWPLLFPMVKSLVKAMDAIQEFAKQEWKTEVKGFVVSGASKRGWTTWLTGAADNRVKAIAPLVIDTLNMLEQMKHQKESFGEYSEQIADYTRAGLVPLPDTDEARKLWKMVDPYTHRDRVKVPKMLLNGNNDPYWTVDALNLYWDGLEGEKNVVYVPNAGHNLEQKDADGRPDRSRALGALAAFGRRVVTGKAMPKLEWKHEGDGETLRLTVKADQAPAGARLWVADSKTRDFRQSRWEERTARLADGTVVGEVERPKEGYRVFYAELDYDTDGIKHHLSTQVRVVGPKAP